MATPAKPQPTSEPLRHHYHATAGILSAKIKQPLQKEVRSQVVRLPEDGGYEFRHVEPLRLEGILSYKSGYAQVAGFAGPDGFTTLTTSVVEGLNILDVITADRVVGQIHTNYPVHQEGQDYKEAQVPSVSFLGTRFDNLRINGQQVEVVRCLDILGPKPAGDRSYLEDEVVLWKISEQAKGLPGWARDHWKSAAIQDISQPGETSAHCSLVSKLRGLDDISFGHVIDLPHFGKIFLAELRVTRKKGKHDVLKFDASTSDASTSDSPQPDIYSFDLTMIKVDLDGAADGDVDVSPCDSNGSGGKGSPNPPPGPPQ